MRLDVFLAEKGLVKSRERAKNLVIDGKVSVDGVIVNKPSFEVVYQNVSVSEDYKYVGRGGYKLEKALDYFKIDVENLTAIDIGASTGGFSDCLLQRGVKKIFAVDVGHGQLDKKILNDERVVNLEGVNIRSLSANSMDSADIIVVDLSFISLKLVLSELLKFLKTNGMVICLLKPQFETGKIKNKGVVRDKKVHFSVVHKIVDFAVDCGFFIRGLTFSPIKGSDGNIEYLIYMDQKKHSEYVFDIHDLVNNAFENLE